MNEEQLTGIIGQGGIAAALMAIIWRVGNALVLAIKELRAEIAEHTKTDLAHHAKVGTQIAELNGKIDGVLDQADRFTPVQEIPREMSRPVRARSEPGGERR